MSSLKDLHYLQNLDDQSVLETFERSILNANSSNFALYFDDLEAFGAVDLDKNKLNQFLDAKKPYAQGTTNISSNVTRWINLWTPNTQTESLDSLAKRYGFSPRLLALMETNPPPPKEKPSGPSKPRITNWWEPVNSRAGDTEHHASSIELNENKEPIADQALKLNHYDIVREIWHFFSVDFGPKYICIGYNSLYNTGRSGPNKQRLAGETDSKPAGTRAWAWLVLCEDNTVISIHENLKTEPHLKNPIRSQELAIIRRHIKHVLRRLSKPAERVREENPIMTLTLRKEVDSLNKQPLHSVESSSLLFYYLFDDWYTSYSLVARKDHQYGAKLETLRKELFENAAELQQVNRLHQYGRQLSVLRKIYQSYDRIIQRILDRQKTLIREESPAQQGSRSTLSPNLLGTPLHNSAIVRFQALQDRINLFPLSEIDECLSEKDALVQVSFNLISLKEASFVDRLTRITILLAKATILFLPVSLMTAYFTIPLTGTDADYTAKQYWIAFAVLIAVTYMILLLFGHLSGTQDTKTIYQSLASIFLKKVKEKSGRGVEKQSEQ